MSDLVYISLHTDDVIALIERLPKLATCISSAERDGVSRLHRILGTARQVPAPSQLTTAEMECVLKQAIRKRDERSAENKPVDILDSAIEKIERALHLRASIPVPL